MYPANLHKTVILTGQSIAFPFTKNLSFRPKRSEVEKTAVPHPPLKTCHPERSRRACIPPAAPQTCRETTTQDSLTIRAKREDLSEGQGFSPAANKTQNNRL
jgi:hypothetical protein